MTNEAKARVNARDGAMQTLNRATAGVAVGAFAGVGVLAVVSAATIPGTSAANSSPAASTATETSSSATASTSSGSSTSSIQPSGGVSSTTSGSGVAVSGGSHP